jgi:hypothetical protein
VTPSQTKSPGYDATHCVVCGRERPESDRLYLTEPKCWRCVAAELFGYEDDGERDEREAAGDGHPS